MPTGLCAMLRWVALGCSRGCVPEDAGQKCLLFFLSAKVVNTAIGRDVKDALAGYPIPVLNLSIGHRIAFAESAGQGQTVLETLPKGAAAREIRDLAQSLRRLYGKESIVRHKARA
jgi:hypothetical protein